MNDGILVVSMSAFESYKASETCLCGRTFHQPSAFANHKRTCARSRRQLTSALDKAKQIWAEKKRIRLQRGTTLESATATVSVQTMIPRAALAIPAHDSDRAADGNHTSPSHPSRHSQMQVSIPLSDAESEVCNLDTVTWLETWRLSQLIFSLVIVSAESGGTSG